MEYGKASVVEKVGRLLIDRRITLAQYDALLAAKFIDDPKVFCQIIEVRGHEEIMVMVDADNALYAPLSTPLIKVKES
ncbi:hypothetical protein D3C85_344150 [compost metagenome]